MNLSKSLLLFLSFAGTLYLSECSSGDKPEPRKPVSNVNPAQPGIANPYNPYNTPSASPYGAPPQSPQAAPQPAVPTSEKYPDNDSLYLPRYYYD